jgi:S-adenosyl-L-methionine hydrolase (adenosine-forming)
MNRNIALLTDFGTADWFAASMKGVILSINPAAVITDITHDIPPGDIQSAAFCLRSCFSCFPKETVFAVVVDPGVGGKRSAIAVKAGEYFFVGPDNGVFSAAVENVSDVEIRSITSPACMRSRISATFHGRDIFAPAAARLSLGFPFEDVGPVLTGMIRYPIPVAETEGERICGTVLYIDRFGNVITNIPPTLVPHGKDRLQVADNAFPLRTCYTDVAEGELVALTGSCGFIEFSINKGNAAQHMGCKAGDRVVVG